MITLPWLRAEIAGPGRHACHTAERKRLLPRRTAHRLPISGEAIMAMHQDVSEYFIVIRFSYTVRCH